MITLRRRFADLSFGQMHYRIAGEGPTLLLLHASPGSSKQLEPLMRELAVSRRVIAPDTPGNGDSDPLPQEQPAIGDYARAMHELLDTLGIARVDAYGSHTGACIAAELAIVDPGRVGRVIQDGIGIFSPDEQREYVEHYAKPFPPDLDGAYLMRAFTFCRDQYLFFPWYARNRAKRRDSGLASAQSLHVWLVEVLKAATTYPLAYRAAFSYPAALRLPLVQQPVLCMAAADDPLLAGTRDIVPRLAQGRFLPLPRFDDPACVARAAGGIVEFLDQSL